MPQHPGDFGEWERAAWEQRAAAYAASLGDLTRGSIPALLDAAAVGPDTRLLDVGTGPGFVAVHAVGRGATVSAVDQSVEMVRIAREAGVDVVGARADALPFPQGRFDAVVAGYVLNHVPSPEQVVAETSRVLRVGGRFATTVWDVPEANPVTGLLGPIVTALGLTAVVPDGPDAYRLSDTAEARSLLRQWDDVAVERVRWQVRVEPGAWFDALADATPRTGAVLAQAGPVRRAQARRAYIAEASRLYGAPDGTVVLPAAAVLISATRPAG